MSKDRKSFWELQQLSWHELLLTGIFNNFKFPLGLTRKYYIKQYGELGFSYSLLKMLG